MSVDATHRPRCCETPNVEADQRAVVRIHRVGAIGDLWCAAIRRMVGEASLGCEDRGPYRCTPGTPLDRTASRRPCCGPPNAPAEPSDPCPLQAKGESLRAGIPIGKGSSRPRAEIDTYLAGTLERKLGTAFKHLALKLRRFAFLPQFGLIADPISQRATVGALAALKRARDAHKLSFE